MSIPIDLPPQIVLIRGTPDGPVVFAEFPDKASCWKVVRGLPEKKIVLCLPLPEARQAFPELFE